MRRGLLTEREAHHVRANYGAKLSMIDHWLGRLLDSVDEAGLWPTTAVILCTDHGHYLGEDDVWGKPAIRVGETLGHLPLLVAWPGVAPGRTSALTTNVDLHATLCDVFGVTPEHAVHGRLLVPLLWGEAGSIRDHVLFGYWGREVQVSDGRIVYSRAPAGDNFPLSLWSNRWSTMPVHGADSLRLPRPDSRAVLDRMPGSTVPVIRQPFAPGDALPNWALGTRADRHALFDVMDDPSERHDLAGSAAEETAVEMLRSALSQIDAPREQLARLGVA